MFFSYFLQTEHFYFPALGHSPVSENKKTAVFVIAIATAVVAVSMVAVVGAAVAVSLLPIVVVVVVVDGVDAAS